MDLIERDTDGPHAIMLCNYWYLLFNQLRLAYDWLVSSLSCMVGNAEGWGQDSDLQELHVPQQTCLQGQDCARCREWYWHPVHVCCQSRCQARVRGKKTGSLHICRALLCWSLITKIATRMAALLWRMYRLLPLLLYQHSHSSLASSNVPDTSSAYYVSVSRGSFPPGLSHVWAVTEFIWFAPCCSEVATLG